jgi:four helix bundle protein
MPTCANVQGRDRDLALLKSHADGRDDTQLLRYSTRSGGNPGRNDGTVHERPGRMARDLDDRLFAFACRAVDIFDELTARGGAAREVARQFLRAATSMGANAAEANAGQTKADFVAKLGIARKECRETLFWLRLIEVKRLLPANSIAPDLNEARQIAAILTAIVKKALETDRRG